MNNLTREDRAICSAIAVGWVEVQNLTSINVMSHIPQWNVGYRDRSTQPTINSLVEFYTSHIRLILESKPKQNRRYTETLPIPIHWCKWVP